MKTFFRVEHGVDKYLRKYYLGMYQSSVAITNFKSYRVHIMPFEDRALCAQIDLVNDDHSPDYIYAFPDTERLHMWLYDKYWLEELHRLGYVLSVYECDDGYHGDSQSIFNWEKAQLKHRLNLLEV